MTKINNEFSSKKQHSKIKELLFVLLITFISFSQLTTDSFASADIKKANDESEEEKAVWRGFATPFLFANSDDGFVFGLGLGLSKDPGLYLISGLELTTKGNNRVAVETEWYHKNNTIVLKVDLGRTKRYLYPATEISPDYFAKADMEDVEFRLSYMKKYKSSFEAGPTLWVESIKGLNPVDQKNNEISYDGIDIFNPAFIALAGYRFRSKTTSAVRPTDGYVIDISLMGGVSNFNLWSDPKEDMYSKLIAALAKPLNNNFMTYFRIAGSYQLNAPAPLQNYNGGFDRVRGHADRREYGRRIIWGRSELHWTLTRKFDWPQRVAHSIFSFFPTWPLELEIVPFYDFGMAGDPSYGWNRTRHGLGAGIHFILPPELVLRLDLAAAPGGELFYYFTIKQSL